MNRREYRPVPLPTRPEPAPQQRQAPPAPAAQPAAKHRRRPISELKRRTRRVVITWTAAFAVIVVVSVWFAREEVALAPVGFGAAVIATLITAATWPARRRRR